MHRSDLVLVFGAVAWWIFSPDHAYRTRSQVSNNVRLLIDSSEVRHLITVEETRVAKDAAMRKTPVTPGHYPLEHLEFLEAMNRQLANTAPIASYARLLIRSHAPCEADPTMSPKFVKVRITSGDKRGVEGWVCEDELAPRMLIDSQNRRPRSILVATESRPSSLLQ
jgi:hypothetical protein